MKKTVLLHENWEIKELPQSTVLNGDAVRAYSSAGNRTGDWIPAAAMPAQVHDILMEAGRIENYALEGRCDKFEWVAQRDWLYRCTFSSSHVGGHAKLRFNGLDTFVTVYLNGERIGSHQSMYRALEIDVTGRIQTENTLLLHFRSPYAFIEEYEAANGKDHPVSAVNAMRKPGDDFSRYLGAQPKCVTPVGIFDQVSVSYTDQAAVSFLDIESHLTDDYHRAVIDAAVEVENIVGAALQVKLTISDPEGKEAASASAFIAPEEKKCRCRLTVDNPRLWWPVGYGEQPLYTVTAVLERNGVVCDQVAKQIGLREVRMEARFDFRINGKAVKLWGGDFAPIGKGGISHVFDSAHFLKVMDLVENGMNCLRIWGPGEPYPDQPYQEADRRGILLWQEFYGDSGPYPETEEFVNECREDAVYLLKRLKHHPSILMWCGGNESLMWAHIADPAEKVYGKGIYLDEIRMLAEEYDPQRFYLPSCPMGGLYPNDPIVGDTHGLEHRWWFVPGCDYPYFFSENTRVSPPGMKSLLRFMKPEEIWPQGYTGAARPGDEYQIPPAWYYYSAEAGNEMWVKFGPVEQYFTPTCGEELVYNVAAARAQHFKEAVGRCRRGRPHYESDRPRRCFGHLVWKLNDTLPQIYSAVVDYYSEPYIPYYAMIRAYAPLLISFEVDDQVYVWVTNDSGEPVEGTLVCKVFDPVKNEFVPGQELSVPLSVEHDQSKLAADLYRFGAVFAASPEIGTEEWKEFVRQTNAEKTWESGKWVRGEKEEYYVQSYGDPGSNWKLLCVLPNSHFTSQMGKVRQNGIWIALAAISISFFCIAVIINSLSRKVNLLVRRADDIAKGDYYNDIQLEDNDELAVLSTRLNSLAKQLDELIQCSVEQEKRNGEIEYKCLELRYQAMQMQLNPHFIYNSLEIINSVALLERQAEISRLICRFAQMFRFSVQRNNHDVSLGEEMEYIQNYLSFYQMAYSNRIQYRIELPDELRSVRLPSAVLQPLVENALVHGVEKSCRPVNVLVRRFEKDHTLHAAVVDDGPGIKPERLEEIRKLLADEAWKPPKESQSRHAQLMSGAKKFADYDEFRTSVDNMLTRYQWERLDDVSNDGTAAAEKFANGEAAMFLGMQSVVSQCFSTNPDFNVHCVPYPYSDDKVDDHKIVVEVEDGWMVGADTDIPEVCFEWLKYISDEPQAQRWCDDVGMIMVQPGLDTSKQFDYVQELNGYYSGGKSVQNCIPQPVGEFVQKWRSYLQAWIVDPDRSTDMLITEGQAVYDEIIASQN